MGTSFNRPLDYRTLSEKGKTSRVGIHNYYFGKSKIFCLEMRGIDPRASHMLSERSTT